MRNTLAVVKRTGPFLLVAALAACASQPIPEGGEAPGFFMGVLHGFIVLFSLVSELFTDNRIYAFPNSGGWYDFGFVLGVLAFTGGAKSTSSRARKRRG